MLTVFSLLWTFPFLSSPTFFVIVEFIKRCNVDYLMKKKIYMFTSMAVAVWIALHLCTVKWQGE